MPPRFWEPPLDRPKLAAVGAVLLLLVLTTLVRACSGGGSPKPVMAPTVSTPPAASIAVGAPVSVSGAAPAGMTVRLLDNDSPVPGAEVTADPKGHWQLDVAGGLKEGPHRLSVAAQDALGQTAASTPFTLTIASATPTPSATPTIPTFSLGGTAVPWLDLTDAATLQWPTLGGALTAGRMPTLEGSAAVGADIRFWDGNNPVGATQADAKGHWVFPLPELAPGAHQLRVIVSGGRSQGISSDTWTVTVAGATLSVQGTQDTSAGTVDAAETGTPQAPGTATAKPTG